MDLIPQGSNMMMISIAPPRRAATVVQGGMPLMSMAEVVMLLRRNCEQQFALLLYPP
jgi:hypothetical protein